MKKIFSIALLCLVFMSSCNIKNGIVPSREFVTFEVAATKIDAIDVSSSIKIEYTQGPQTEVKVKCPENLVDLLKIEVDNGCLKAGFKPDVTIDGYCDVIVKVRSKSLSGIDASSSSTVLIVEPLVVSNRLDIEASSSAQVSIAKLTRGDIEIDASSSASVTIGSAKCTTLDIEGDSSSEVSVDAIECVSVKAKAESAATVTLSGRAYNARFEASSAAAINAAQLKTERLRGAKASSAANIRCTATTCEAIQEESSGSVTIL